jgi:Rieske Fe-S protein
MAAHEAQAYQDPGTPEEQSRRQFLAKATVAIGAVTGLVLAVPLLTSLVPESLASPAKRARGVWADLPENDIAALSLKPGDPVKIDFRFPFVDGYLPPATEQRSVWGIKLTPKAEQAFKAKRPDLFAPSGAAVDYAPVTMSFVMFSSVCPHLGCSYEWQPEANLFICPCHGSEFDSEGAKVAGPAPRGLDPLPLREQNGRAQITWIKYQADVPDRLIVAYS